MTTSSAARRRSTWIALAIVVATAVAAIGLVGVGAATLANSKAGRDAVDRDTTVLTFPTTPTGLVGVVDDTGHLTSVAAIVVDPSGVGGSIVTIPATADASLDLGDDRLPLDTSLAADGPEVFRAQAEALTSVSFDVAELVDVARLTDIIERVGTLTVTLPADVTLPAPDGGEPTVLAAGENTLDAATAARLLTLRDTDQPSHALDPARDAVWAAIAAQVGGGIGSASTVADGASVPTPASTDELLDRLLAGPVGWRGVTTTLPAADRNPTGEDVVVPDRAELLLVFGQIAPARVAAPNPSLTFRLEVCFSDDELAPFGVNASDVAQDAINRLLFVQANVVSVVTCDDAAPPVTKASVADDSLATVVRESYPLVFGDIELVDLDHRIQGIDVIVTLGTSYLEQLDQAPLQSDDLDGTAFETETTVPTTGTGG